MINKHKNEKLWNMIPNIIYRQQFKMYLVMNEPNAIIIHSEL